MRIIQLKTENVKKVKAIDITPKSDVIVISGDNGQGKTSVLDSIWYALQGKTGLKGVKMPIRKGEKKASVTLKLLDDKTKKVKFIVNRVWTSDDKTYLKVTNGEGLVFSSPQELLDNFIGELAFDPLEFANMKNTDQRQLLLKLANVDIDSLDVKLAELEEGRRLQGQKVKLYEGEREDITLADVPDEEIDITKLQTDVEQAIDHNRDIDASNRKVERIDESISNSEAEICDLKEEIIALQDGIKRAKEEYNSEIEYLKINKKKDVDAIRLKLNKAIETNELVQARKRNFEIEGKRIKAQEVYDDYSRDIEKVRYEKKAVLEEAKMPIKGLSVDDTGVIYNDIPFNQLSSSEQLTVSLCIGMALNPELRVIIITVGSLLDDKTMDKIKLFAKKNKYQIWVEKIDGKGEMGFYIEEGEVKNDRER